MSETIFMKIIRGEIPCHKVYEDDDVLAFLDINPVSPGHCLVLPKEPAETLDQLSDGAAAALGRVLPRICRALMAETRAAGYNLLQNNGAAAYQLVKHVHFHLIPKYEDDRGGLGLALRPHGTMGPEESKGLAKRISERIDIPE